MNERIKVTAVWWQEWDADDLEGDELSEAAIDRVINDPESFNEAEWSVDEMGGFL